MISVGHSRARERRGVPPCSSRAVPSTASTVYAAKVASTIRLSPAPPLSSAKSVCETAAGSTARTATAKAAQAAAPSVAPVRSGERSSAPQRRRTYSANSPPKARACRVKPV
ncbi:hypothetical protein STAL104432_32445 [Streptomyces albus]